MRPDTEYSIDRVEKGPHKMVVHLLREHLIYEYRLPKPYAKLVTDEDVKDINSGKSIYTLKREFTKNERDFFYRCIDFDQSPCTRIYRVVLGFI
jgi:hypothetical protein